MAMELLLTALAAMLLSFLVAKLASAVIGGGETRDMEAEAAAAAVAEGGGVVGQKVDRVVVERFEGVGERCRSDMLTAVVEEEVEVESRLFAEISESGLKEVEEKDGGSEVELGDENVVRSCLDEVVCSAESGRVDEIFEDVEDGDAKAMDVENAGSDGEEMMKDEIEDEVADMIEECIRNIENEECGNEFEGTAEAKDVVDCIGLVTDGENSVPEGGENQFEEDAAKRIGGGEHIANEGYKNQDEETEGPKDVNLEVKDEVTEERSGSSEEDDDWEGIEMSELYNEYKSAAALVRKEEKDGKFSNTGSELKMQLYGLQKIVMEGPCREAQPMAIKMSARAKWNAWQRLGTMNPEDAMKQYIALVSGLKPGSSEVDDQPDNIESTKLSISDPDQSKPQNESQKKKELTCDAEGIDIGRSNL